MIIPGIASLDPRLSHDIAWAEAPGGVPILTAYPDSGGVPTVGLGHTDKHVVIGQTYTEQQCYDWFADDIDDATEAAALLPEWATLNTAARRNAVTECVFNLGLPHWMTFIKTRAAIQKQDWHGAHDNLLDSPKWISQVHLPRVQRLATYLLTGAY